jgi:hypothetical protein
MVYGVVAMYRKPNKSYKCIESPFLRMSQADHRTESLAYYEDSSTSAIACHVDKADKEVSIRP